MTVTAHLAPAPPEPRSRGAGHGGRWLVLATVVVVGGLGGGAFTQLVRDTLGYNWMFWINSVAGWCLPAFAVGVLAAWASGRRFPVELAAVLAGVTIELLMVAAYYVVRHEQGLHVNALVVTLWSMTAVAAGVVFGVGGAWWFAASGWRQGVGLAVIAAMLIGQGVRDAVLSPGRPGHPGLVMALVGLAAAVVLARTWWQRIAVPTLAVALLPVVAVGWLFTYSARYGSLADVLHRVYALVQ
ncbi:DUF6518 family protein [Spongisporangium articulatum]|uniref:DUF6518 family protein n=1 Tax=Spongisporangium articulatum TaxID=3362603 RepID=A0ABW8AQY3_9ACTN